MLVNMLTVLFVGLKLTGHIAWSWIWVLSPIWIAFILAVLVRIPGEYRKQVAAEQLKQKQAEWQRLKDQKNDGE